MKTEKQIEEMAQDMYSAENSDIYICLNGCSKACGVLKCAERTIPAGYRKATDVIDEFVEKVLGKIRYEYENYPSAMTVGTYHQLRKEINELAVEMRQEVEK